MNHGSQPSWERLLWWLIAAVIGLELLANVLPHLLLPLIALAVVIGVLRLIWWYTQP
jgi:hypothetical protein